MIYSLWTVLHLIGHGFPPGSTTLPDKKFHYPTNFAIGSCDNCLDLDVEAIYQFTDEVVTRYFR